jgi:hypothetical protein
MEKVRISNLLTTVDTHAVRHLPARCSFYLGLASNSALLLSFSISLDRLSKHSTSSCIIYLFDTNSPWCPQPNIRSHHCPHPDTAPLSLLSSHSSTFFRYHPVVDIHACFVWVFCLTLDNTPPFPSLLTLPSLGHTEVPTLPIALT